MTRSEGCEEICSMERQVRQHYKCVPTALPIDGGDTFLIVATGPAERAHCLEPLPHAFTPREIKGRHLACPQY